ncbi:hypothetical protein K5X82_07520 [Halosquirtibacter xylanolyticus]|uniref:hypothetical protein n=1 Tax=Halosquirtibacter xylanolyticus TaxID=3374599 RepID=UPI003748FE96|nr:hypothetical protein K5X82_07520 [Prolixibacteraceae bacterium]
MLPFLEGIYYTLPLLLALYFSIHVKYLLGSLVFRYNAFLKTTALLFGIVCLIIMVPNIIALVTDSTFSMVMREFLDFYIFKLFKVPSTYSYSTTWLYPVISLWMIIYNIGLYFVIYYKIKDMEVR